MLCKNCEKNQATVQVTEILEPEASEGPPEVREVHLCEICAQAKHLPHAPIKASPFEDIWQLLQVSAQKARQKRTSLHCGACKLSLEELRQRGRLGCPECYEVFSDYLGELFERVHGAREHRGRLPGLEPQAAERRQLIEDLRAELETAISEEAYERAAGIRDELKNLESRLESGS